MRPAETLASVAHAGNNGRVTAFPPRLARSAGAAALAVALAGVAACGPSDADGDPTAPASASTSSAGQGAETTEAAPAVVDVPIAYTAPDAGGITPSEKWEDGASVVWEVEDVWLPVTGLASASGELWAYQQPAEGGEGRTTYVFGAGATGSEIWSAPCPTAAAWFGERIACGWTLTDPATGEAQELIPGEPLWLDGPVTVFEDLLILRTETDLVAFDEVGAEQWRYPHNEQTLWVTEGANYGRLADLDSEAVIDLRTGTATEFGTEVLRVFPASGGYSLATVGVNERRVTLDAGGGGTLSLADGPLQCAPPVGEPLLAADLYECPQAYRDAAAGSDADAYALLRGQGQVHVIASDGFVFEFDGVPAPLTRSGAELRMWDEDLVLIAEPGGVAGTPQLILWDPEVNFPYFQVDGLDYQLLAEDLFVAFTSDADASVDRGDVTVLEPINN